MQKLLRIEIGTGSRVHKMNRGSFQTRSKVARRLALTPCDAQGLVWGIKGKAVLRVTCSEGPAGHKLEFTPLEEGYNRLWLRFSAGEDEHFYGCGETFQQLDLRGERVPVWVSEHQNAGRIAKKLLREAFLGKRPQHRLPFRSYGTYYAQPTFVSSGGYYVHVDTASYMEFDFRRPGEVCLELTSFPSVYTGAAPDFPALLEQLTSLLGRQPELPDWLYEGAVLGIQGGCGAVDEKLRRAREAGMKIAGVWCQDWQGERITAFGKQLMWNWEFDPALYPALPEKIRAWNRDGVRFMGYINPFLAIEKPLYREASAKGYCVKNAQGGDYMVKITTFDAAMVDFTNPAAYEWIKGIIKKNMIGIGLHGWMADFGEYLPMDCVLHSGENPAEIHNRWPGIWAKINREAVEECGKLGEIAFFTRAGYTETIRHSTMMWTGDQHVDWSVCDGLQSVIPATLSLSMSGYGLTHSDTGGYTTFHSMTRQPELLIRWAELNAFSPFFRSHEGNQPDRNVHFDHPDVLPHYARMSRIHHALAPYLKACVQQNAARGTAVMRPMFWYYDEPQAFTDDTQYLLGRDILVAPVMQDKARARRVYLPDDRWVHLWTGKAYAGGCHDIDAPLGCPPVFYRKEAEQAALFAKIGGMK